MRHAVSVGDEYPVALDADTGITQDLPHPGQRAATVVELDRDVLHHRVPVAGSTDGSRVVSQLRVLAT